MSSAPTSVFGAKAWAVVELERGIAEPGHRVGGAHEEFDARILGLGRVPREEAPNDRSVHGTHRGRVVVAHEVCPGNLEKRRELDDDGRARELSARVAQGDEVEAEVLVVELQGDPEGDLERHVERDLRPRQAVVELLVPGSESGSVTGVGGGPQPVFALASTTAATDCTNAADHRGAGAAWPRMAEAPRRPLARRCLGATFSCSC